MYMYVESVTEISFLNKPGRSVMPPEVTPTSRFVSTLVTNKSYIRAVRTSELEARNVDLYGLLKYSLLLSHIHLKLGNANMASVRNVSYFKR